jgi:hypothetical protein
MMQENQNRRSAHADGAGGRQNQKQFDPSKMDEPSRDESITDNDFPGYPHYPPSEDIMNPANNLQRVSVDVENLAPPGVLSSQASAKKSTSGNPGSAQQSEDEIKIVPGTEADVTREDLRLLNATEGSYANASNATTVTGEDLDVPGADADDPNEDIGEEDEENNYYSLGGDNHENLEEDPS